MRIIYGISAALLTLTAISALAQSPSMDPTTGARPGHEPGVGESLPRSNNSSNIGPSDTRSNIAPTLPPSELGDNATTVAYLREARASFVAGRTGEAQQALEMAETRALERRDTGKLVAQIREARQALGAGNKSGAIALIDIALAG